jgi:oligosaccharide repeat unit polymerase
MAGGDVLMHAHRAARLTRGTRSLTNPFAAYAAGFLIALTIYSLGYSDLYPPLQPSLKWFLLSTCVICVFLAYGTGGMMPNSSFKEERFGKHLAIFTAIMGAFAIEVVVSGGIPLLLIAANADFSYRDFGIPELHVAFVSFCYFFAVYWFDLYILGQGRRFLILSTTALGTSVLMVNRGAFILTLIAIIFVYIQRRGFDRRILFTFAAATAVTLWGFGLLGDLRTSGATGESIILRIGDASDKFLNSNIPTGLFWPYLYASSPLANLQLNITDRIATDSPALYVALEFLPDFISKRIVSDDAIAGAGPLLITEELTVSTMYGRSFLLMGWLGLFLSFSYFVVISIICLKVLRRSKYFVAAAGILSSLAFLCIFDNLYIKSGGISLVLVAIFLAMFEHKPTSEYEVISGTSR